MKFLADLLPDNGDKKKFPPETEDGSVEIVGNKIISTGKHGIYNCEVNIDGLQYAYITINTNKQAFLFLFDHHQNSLSVNYRGFGKVYETLSQKFNFDNTIFFDNVNKSHPLKKKIWQRKHRKSYEILEESNLEYAEGFEIQSPEKEFVSWETTYDEFEKNENVFFRTSVYGQKMLCFKYPVKIGNILLRNFEAYFDNPRKDVPVLHFHVECYDEASTDRSYKDLKKILVADIGISKDRYNNYEREDQKNLNFNMDGMNLSICYTYDSAWQFDGGYTSFTIHNNREYSSLLMDEYENEIVVSDFMLLEGNVSMSGDYKRNKKVKRRPPFLSGQFKDKAMIWSDDKNNKIGFADKNYSQVFDKNEIKSFSVQNILPAKGGGGAYLEIVMEGKNNYVIFNENCHFFDKYVNTIRSITEKDLTFAPEYHDC
ncbi:MAG: hypothetical protein K0S32_1783 [Bacteroidetes bacterium]|jgi:hypothetical protein|nr:hypothetical protein [Bacteroidota bacterium]